MAEDLEKTLAHPTDDALAIDAAEAAPHSAEVAADAPDANEAPAPEAAPDADEAPEPDAAPELEVASTPDALDDTQPAPQPVEPPRDSFPAAASYVPPSVTNPAVGPLDTVTQPMPEPVEAPRPSAPSPSVDTPRLRDVGATFAGWARGRAAAAGAFLGSHRPVALALALACVGIILAGVLWGIDATQTPTDEQIRADAQERLAAPAHTASPYEPDKPLMLQSLEIGRKQTSGTRHDACDVSAEAVFSNGSIESRADAQLTYVRKGDTWTCTAATVGKASHRALTGISQERALSQLETLLQAADDAESESLVGLYRDASASIADESFDADAQTDQLTLHCVSQGTFVSYECDLTARFRFASASGAWELASATVSDGARDLSFAPLVGTWQGTFARQEAEVGKCLSARNAGLTVTVEHAELTQDGDARISGTLTGMAHFHATLADDVDATEGDTPLEAVPFTGALSSGYRELDIISLLAGNNPTSDAAGIVFDCTTQDLAEGRVTLTLTFGQADAPDAASATLTSTHAYEDYILLFVPYQREARFVDHFTLEKVG